MTFPLTPASPYVAFTTVITSAALNAYRVCINEALDGTGGGVYAPMAQITIGGSGLKLTGATALELDGTSVATQDVGGNFNVNGTVTIKSGGQILVTALGAINVGGDSAPFDNGYLNINQYGILYVHSGGNVALNGAMSIGGTGSITLGPDAGIIWGPGTAGHPAVAQFDAFSTATWVNGSTLQGTGSTAIFTWAGPATLSNTVLMSNAVTLSGTVSLSGALTQTSAGTYLQQGIRTKSGATGYDIERVVPFATSQTITPSDGDLYLFNSVTNTTITLTLANPTVNGIRIRIAASSTTGQQATGTLLIKTAAGAGIGQLGPGTIGGGAFGGAGFADYESVSGAWICIGSIQGG